MEQVLSGVWQMDRPSPGGKAKTVLFVINLSKEPAEAELRLFPREYGVDCPERLRLTLAPTSVKILNFE
jgi:hypothetical protein